MKAKSSQKASQRHIPGHSPLESGCAICRIKFLEEKAAAGNWSASLAIERIALAATHALERLRQADEAKGKVSFSNRIAQAVEWPIIATYPEQERPWIKKLGTEPFLLPLPFRLLSSRETKPRQIIGWCFATIVELRLLSERRQLESDAVFAGTVTDRNFLRAISESAGKPEEEAVLADYRDWCRKIMERPRFPEEDIGAATAEERERTVFKGICECLKISLSAERSKRIINRFIGIAAKLYGWPEETAKWYRLGKLLLRSLVGELAHNDELRQLAPGRGFRKGGNKESLTEIRTRILERLDVTFANITRERL